VAAPDVVQDAFEVWQGQIAAADEWLDSSIDLGAMIGMVNGYQTSVHVAGLGR